MRTIAHQNDPTSNTHSAKPFFSKNRTETFFHPSQNQPFFSPAPIQTKLTVGPSTDKYEQEADAVADKVMHMPKPASIQRKCNQCENEKESIQTKPLVSYIQRKESSSNHVASDAISHQLNTTKGGGSPMPDRTQTFMESRFGTNFSNVRIHTGTPAIQMSKELNAQAFTSGRDVYFNQGKYNPASDNGKKLLAHELTHVVQQGSANPSIQRLTATERTEDLNSEKYRGNARLQQAFDNNPFLGPGNSGKAVRLVQEGLVADGFPMPRSTKPSGQMDGGFGAETFQAVKAFQGKHSMAAIDGVVGRETMGKLDVLAKKGGSPSSEKKKQKKKKSECPKHIHKYADIVKAKGKNCGTPDPLRADIIGISYMCESKSNCLDKQTKRARLGEANLAARSKCREFCYLIGCPDFAYYFKEEQKCDVETHCGKGPDCKDEPCPATSGCITVSDTGFNCTCTDKVLVGFAGDRKPKYS